MQGLRTSHRLSAALTALLLGLAPVAAFAAPPADAVVERTGPHALTVRWSSPDPVDVLLADKADAEPSAARLLSPKDRDGVDEIADVASLRPYVLLRNARTGEIARVAERLVPLEQGSNFRDLGGYGVEGGRHVRWGLIYRSGATPLLDAADIATVKSLGLATMIDLRSDEERVLAPSRIDGVPYTAVGYSISAIGMAGGMENVYRTLPTMLTPQLKLVFAALLRDEGPLVFNCSAGQDRTGFTAAMVLSALGAPRDTIVSDYHLSTRFRRPEFEMPKIEADVAARNPVAAMFAAGQNGPMRQAQPLMTADGTAFLSFAFAEIESKWGSVDGYLQNDIGLQPADIQRLRAIYTE